MDFQNFLNILDKVKYLGPYLSKIFFTILCKTRIFANNQFTSLEKISRFPVKYKRKSSVKKYVLLLI